MQYKLNLLLDNQQLRWRGRRYLIDAVVCPSCSFLDVDAAPLYMLFVYPP